MRETWEGYLARPGASEPQDGDITIRPSTVTSMGYCPARVGYSLTEGFVDAPSEAMSFGTLVHAMCEGDLNGAVLGPARPAVRSLWGELVRDEYHVEIEELATEGRIDASVQEALTAFYLWQEDIRPLFLGSEKLVEEVLWRPLGVLPDGRAVWLHGTPDLVTVGPNVVWDWKTANSGWKDSRAHFEAQPSAYPWLASERLGVLPEDFITRFAVYNRKKQEWSVKETVRTAAQIDSWLRIAWQRARQIAFQVFPATPIESMYGDYKRMFLCSPRWCGAWDVCEMKHLADGLDEATPIDVTEGWL